MTDYPNLTDRLMKALRLDTMPVAFSTAESAPPGHARPSGRVAAGCQFWELGASEALATTAEDHQRCAIGIHTHNLRDAPDTQASELAATLGAMTGLDYVREAEVAAIPVLESAAAIAAYTPLAECREDPDLVLLFCDAAQGLVLTEAIARVDGEAPVALGRPACALVPAVAKSGRAAASLGCCGARAYLSRLDEGTTVWALPGAKLDAYAAEVDILAKANDTLAAFHERRRADIEAGEDPTVGASLARLSE